MLTSLQWIHWSFIGEKPLNLERWHLKAQREALKEGKQVVRNHRTVVESGKVGKILWPSLEESLHKPDEIEPYQAFSLCHKNASRGHFNVKRRALNFEFLSWSLSLRQSYSIETHFPCRSSLFGWHRVISTPICQAITWNHRQKTVDKRDDEISNAFEVTFSWHWKYVIVDSKRDFHYCE